MRAITICFITSAARSVGRVLVFNDEIAALQRMRIGRQISEVKKIAGNIGEAEVWAKQGRRKGPNECGSRIGVRRVKGSKKQRGAMEDKDHRASVSFSIRSLICTCTACTLAAPTHPLNYKAALDSWSEAGYWKGVVVGMCGLWSKAEPSQNKRKRARGLINRWVNNTIDGSIDEWINAWVRGWKAFHLTGEELSIYAHQSTQRKNRPSHNQYQNLASLLPPPFGSLGLTECGPPTRPRLGLPPHHSM